MQKKCVGSGRRCACRCKAVKKKKTETEVTTTTMKKVQMMRIQTKQGAIEPVRQDASSSASLVAAKAITKKKRKAEKGAAWLLGNARKCVGGVVLLLHPLVANVSFRAVHCKQLPLRASARDGSNSAQFVVASDLGRACFGAEHLPTLILALLAISLCVVAFPISALIRLARSAACCTRSSVCRWGSAGGDGDGGSGVLHPARRLNAYGEHSQAAAAAGAAEKASEGEGGEEEDCESGELPPSSGLCCRCAPYLQWLHRRRAAFNLTHDKYASETQARCVHIC